MRPAFDIRRVRTEADAATTAGLFQRYAASLPIDLGYQGFTTEVAVLPGPYASPAGELLLARDAEGAPIGCVGLRPLGGDGCAEMKRLFLAPEARGLGLGRALAEAIIGAARRLGYRELRLDTLDTMTVAIGLYETLGFVRIAPYYAPTPAGTVFMSLAL